MLTIHYKNGTNQVIRVHSQFYLTVVQGKGKNKKILTPQEKSLSLMQTLGGCGFTLSHNEEKLLSYGIIPTTKENISFAKNVEEKIQLSKMKYFFKKDTKAKYPGESKQLSHNQLWNKYASRAIIASSNTQNYAKK